MLTKCLKAVYYHSTLFVATRSPAWRRSIAMAERKKSLISSQSALAATHPGDVERSTASYMSLGSTISAMLCKRAEYSLQMSCS